MLEPSFYPHRPDSVELRETHISWVFRAGPLAYKLKKPLVLPFLDYGTAARRGEMCKEEVLLNRRLAPRLYRRVVSIVARGEGFALSWDDDPAAVDYAVEMEVVDEERSLEALSEAGTLPPPTSRRSPGCSPGSTPRRASSTAPKPCAPTWSRCPRT